MQTDYGGPDRVSFRQYLPVWLFELMFNVTLVKKYVA